MTDRAKSTIVFTGTTVWLALFLASVKVNSAELGESLQFGSIIMIVLVGVLMAAPTARPQTPEQRMAKRLEKKGHPVLLVHKECECCQRNGYSPRHHRRLASLANASDHQPTIPGFVPKPPKGEGGGSHKPRQIDHFFIRDLELDRQRLRDIEPDRPRDIIVVKTDYETYEPPESPKTEPRLVQTWDQYGKRRA